MPRDRCRLIEVRDRQHEVTAHHFLRFRVGAVDDPFAAGAGDHPPAKGKRAATAIKEAQEAHAASLLPEAVQAAEAVPEPAEGAA